MRRPQARDPATTQCVQREQCIMGACASSENNSGGNVAVSQTKATPRATIIPSKTGKNAAQGSLAAIGAQLASELAGEGIDEEGGEELAASVCVGGVE